MGGEVRFKKVLVKALIKHRGEFADRNTGAKSTANPYAGPKVCAVGENTDRGAK